MPPFDGFCPCGYVGGCASISQGPWAHRRVLENVLVVIFALEPFTHFARSWSMTFRACALAILSQGSASTNTHNIKPYPKNMSWRRHYAPMLVVGEKRSASVTQICHGRVGNQTRTNALSLVAPAFCIRPLSTCQHGPAQRVRWCEHAHLCPQKVLMSAL